MSGRQRYHWGLVLLVAVLLVGWAFTGGGTGGADPAADERAGATSSSPSSSPSSPPSHQFTATTTPTRDPQPAPEVDPVSGLPVVPLADLPREAAETVELIDAGGPFPEPRHDGGVFENREELLPDRSYGYYREYTVPTPGSQDRGARRIVAGDDDELYWTADHYQSFSLIARSP